MNNWTAAFIILAIIGSLFFNSDAKNFVTGLLNIRPSNAVKLIPSEMQESGISALLLKSCAGVESLGESQGISNPKEKVCREACGKRSMDYSSYDCEKDLLVCYCL